VVGTRSKLAAALAATPPAETATQPLQLPGSPWGGWTPAIRQQLCSVPQAHPYRRFVRAAVFQLFCLHERGGGLPDGVVLLIADFLSPCDARLSTSIGTHCLRHRDQRNDESHDQEVAPVAATLHSLQKMVIRRDKTIEAVREHEKQEVELLRSERKELVSERTQTKRELAKQTGKLSVCQNNLDAAYAKEAKRKDRAADLRQSTLKLKRDSKALRDAQVKFEQSQAEAQAKWQRERRAAQAEQRGLFISRKEKANTEEQISELHSKLTATQVALHKQQSESKEARKTQTANEKKQTKLLARAKRQNDGMRFKLQNLAAAKVVLTKEINLIAIQQQEHHRKLELELELNHTMDREREDAQKQKQLATMRKKLQRVKEELQSESTTNASLLGANIKLAKQITLMATEISALEVSLDAKEEECVDASKPIKREYWD